MRRVPVRHPEAGVVRKVLRIAQPASFAEVVPRGAHDRVVRAAPADLRQELRHAPAALLPPAQVLAVGPPAEVVGAFDLAVWTCKERHVLREELFRHRVGKGVRHGLLVLGVETAHVCGKERLRVGELLRRRLEVEAFVDRAAHVLRAAAASVVPEEPAVVLLVAHDGRLVARAGIPRAGIGDDERRLVDHLPVADAVWRDRAPDVGGVHVGIADEEHRKASVGQRMYLAAGHAVAIPRFAWAAREHHALLFPVDAVLRLGVAVSVRLVRPAGRVPHAPQLALFVPEDARTHYRGLFVVFGGHEHGVFLHALEVDAVRRAGVADAALEMLLRALPRVP